MSDPQDEVSRCLEDLESGDDSAMGRLLPLIYGDLRRIAGVIQRRGEQNTVLHPTALVHEAYGRLVDHGAHAYEGRRHFMRVASMAMRQLLADRARERRAQKRGGNAERITLQEDPAVTGGPSLDLIALDDALTKLAADYPRQAQVVELRFLAGLSVEETAAALEIAPRTAKLDWQMARGWLRRELEPDESA